MAGNSTNLYVGVNALVFKTAGAKVYDLDVAFVRLFQQNVLGLQVAVYHLRHASNASLAKAARVRHLFLLEVPQTNEHLQRKAADEGQRQPLELIVLDELVPDESA
jgi:hypothetical protein